MGNIKENLQKVYAECTKLFNEGHISAVKEHVIVQQEKNNPLYEDVKYQHCTACDTGQPTLNNICLCCSSFVVPEIGRKVRTIGEVKELLKDFDNKDIAILEACDDQGDVEDLYPMYVDVIEGIELLDGSIVREVRFCQMPNQTPEELAKQKPVINAPEFIKNIDFTELRKQKTTLLETMSLMKHGTILDELNGIVHLLDALQDYAVDSLGKTEKEIFNLDDTQ